MLQRLDLETNQSILRLSSIVRNYTTLLSATACIFREIVRLYLFFTPLPYTTEQVMKVGVDLTGDEIDVLLVILKRMSDF